MSAQGFVPVSIIIPVFDRVDFTRRCLESLADTHTPADYEVIVIDNGSTDKTPGYLEEAANKLSRLPNLRVIRNDSNRGFAAACNQGAFSSDAAYILFLNNDTEVRQGWLEPLVRVLDADPGVGIVGARLLYPDDTIQHAGVIIQNMLGGDPLLASHIYAGAPADLPPANEARTYQAVTAACALVRRAALVQVGGFDEGYWNGYEDVDLCFKLTKAGWLVVYEPRSAITHFESRSGPERFAKAQQNIARLHDKWLGRITPDVVVQPDGSFTETSAGAIRPYSAPA